MARRKKRRSGRRKQTYPVAIILPVAAKVVSAAKGAMEGGFTERDVYYQLTGNPDGSISATGFMQAWGPMIAGMAIHFVASKAGVNRALGQAGVPLIRI